MSALTLASVPEDATALEAAEAHHARTAGELAGRVALLTTAAGSDPDAAERLRAGLVAFCDRELLPHAAAEEAALYPAARALPDARLLIVSLVAEHRCLAALVDALRTAATATDAAADARALQVLFEEHTAKENGLVLPLLAMAPGVSLTALLAELHDRLGREPGTEEAAGCGGACACRGGDDEPVPEPEARPRRHRRR
ncbi:hemerythrin domain-containing protein [Streptomyces sp. CC219B]|uniref:hemerythrin domain-containing protein n=1 Tax=Streptomyces sp. CC219B TaxID=3044574 RepID=UPI0024A847DC|nr:hemerythrin domain-containing protein [Streptomyces sp. CC219B]